MEKTIVMVRFTGNHVGEGKVFGEFKVQVIPRIGESIVLPNLEDTNVRCFTVEDVVHIFTSPNQIDSVIEVVVGNK